jgi:hypothetical protein
MLSVFRRRGGPGRFTKPFEELDEANRKNILSRIELKDGEEPAVASVPCADTWVLITTSGTYWCLHGTFGSLPHADLDRANADPPASLGVSSTKLEISRVRLESKSGRSYEIELEPGPPFFGMLSLLKAAS